MKISVLSLKEYKTLQESMELDSIFQFPEYHLLEEKLHPQTHRFEPLKIEKSGKTILAPVVVRETVEGYPEYRLQVNSLSSNKKLTDEDYRDALETLKERNPLRIRFASSLKNPHPFDSESCKIKQKFTFLLELPESFEEWLHSRESETRYKIKKAK